MSQLFKTSPYLHVFSGHLDPNNGAGRIIQVPDTDGIVSWWMVQGAFPNQFGDPRSNQVLRIGWNLGNGGARINGSEPAIGIEMEDYFVASAGQLGTGQMEFHIPYYSTSGAVIRVISFSADRATNFIDFGHQLDKVSYLRRSDGLQLLITQAANSFQWEWPTLGDGVVQGCLAVTRNLANGGFGKLQYNKSTTPEQFEFTNTGSGTVGLALPSNVGLGTNSQATAAFFMNIGTATWDGLTINYGSASPSGVMFSVGGAGIPRFRVLNTRCFFNNGVDVQGFSDNQATKKWQISGASGLVTTYNGINTISGGVPAEYAATDLTAQSAAVGPTTIFATVNAGTYRVTWSAKVTTPATTSSTLGGAGGLQILYTDNDDSVVVTTPAWWGGGNNGAAPTSAAGNTTQTQVSGEIIVNAKAATNIQYQFGYTSAGATAMQYSLHIKVEAM